MAVRGQRAGVTSVEVKVKKDPLMGLYMEEVSLTRELNCREAEHHDALSFGRFELAGMLAARMGHTRNAREKTRDLIRSKQQGLSQVT